MGQHFSFHVLVLIMIKKKEIKKLITRKATQINEIPVKILRQTVRVYRKGALGTNELIKPEIIIITVCYYHVMYAFQSESTLSSCLDVKEPLVQNRHDI